MTRAQVLGFDWSFLDEVSRWALAATAVASVVGTLITGSAWFAVACIVAAGIDIAMVEYSVHRARRELAAGRIDTIASVVMLAGRLIVKAGLLTAAFFAKESGVLGGAIAGVLIFDVTLAFGGSLIAIGRGLRSPREGG